MRRQKTISPRFLGGLHRFMGRRQVLALTFAGALSASCLSAGAATYTVSNTNNAGAGSLRQAILDANASGAIAGIVNGSNTITVTVSGTILLGDSLPMVFSDLTINGNGITVDGGGSHRCFFVSGLPTTPSGSPQAIIVALNDLHLDNCMARGGDGGSMYDGGGGGLGAGAALFVDNSAAVTLTNVSFDANAAEGGNGGNGGNDGSGGGGGGMGGAGGGGNCLGAGGGIGGNGNSGPCDFTSMTGSSGGAGGIGGPGGFGFGSASAYGAAGGGGWGGTGIGQISATQGFGQAGTGYDGLSGGSEGGGGGGGGVGSTGGASGLSTGAGGDGGGQSAAGGGGGFSAGTATAAVGGSGGVGGGAGGSVLAADFISGADGGFGGGGGYGGNGGFGGGGGGQGNGGFGGGGGGGSGQGGFGGGGGGGYPPPGIGGFGGGAGGPEPGGAGGGGAAMGGAIFVVDGGSIMFNGTGSLANGQVTAGITGTPAGANGSAYGTGIFLQGTGALTLNAANNALYTFSDDIADEAGSNGAAANTWSLQVGGDSSGNVILAGDNTYVGPTNVKAGGVLQLDGQMASTITVDSQGMLLGMGNAKGGLINNGTAAPHYPQLSTSDYSQGAGGILSITADQVGSPQVVVSGTAGIGGLLYLDFSATPVIGATYTVLTAGALNGMFAGSATFDEQSGHANSVFGEITYATNTNGTRSVRYTVLATDEIFRDSFEGPNGTYTGACMSKQAFADIPTAVLADLPICVPPFTVTDSTSGTTVLACQTSMCTSTVAGCATTLRTASGTLTGSLASSYQVATPLTADDFSGPLHITGLAGTVDCTGTLSGTSAQLDTTYLAALDYLGDAFVYELDGAQTQNLTTNLSASGCGFYGYATSFVQPYVIQQMQVQINNIINSYLPSPDYYGPGVGDTICPAP